MRSRRDFAIGIGIGSVVGWLFASLQGEWRPAGEDRIVNSRTGELRVTTTGENLDVFLKRVRNEQRLAEAAAEVNAAEVKSQAADAEAWWTRNPHLRPKDHLGGWDQNFLLEHDAAKIEAAKKERALRAAEK